MRKAAIVVALIVIYIYAIHSVHAGSQPIRSKAGLVISASDVASQVQAFLNARTHEWLLAPLCPGT
jgi:hypothetical protein